MCLTLGNFNFHFHCGDMANFIGKPFICNVCYVSRRGQRDDLYQICDRIWENPPYVILVSLMHI